jgi:hypothetical protein
MMNEGNTILQSISLCQMFNYYEKGNDERNFKGIKAST